LQNIHQRESTMAGNESIRDDLNYVASTVRRQEYRSGVPAIYFMWAAIVLVGFALPDFASRAAGPYWFVTGTAGGLLSWWLGDRAGRKSAFNDKAMGRLYGWHWMIGGFGFLLAGLPVIVGQVSIVTGSSSFLLVGGVVYALAGVHLEALAVERPADACCLRDDDHLPAPVRVDVHWRHDRAFAGLGRLVGSAPPGE
jgi:hypothetical protein